MTWHWWNWIQCLAKLTAIWGPIWGVDLSNLPNPSLSQPPLQVFPRDLILKMMGYH